MVSNNLNVYGDASLWGEQEWRKYVTSHWRSEKSRELDKLGGLGRPAIGRGNSFKMKMEYLGSSLLNQADTLESLFDEAKKKGPRQSPTTSLASLSKKHQLSGKSNDAVVAVLVADGSLSNEHDEASIMMRNDVEISAATDGSGASSSALTVIPAAAAAAACSTVAAWRLRVHQARRRTLLLLVCVFRFRSCLKRKGSSGGGLQRIDSFSYMIPQMLGEDCSKFIAQQKRLLARRDLLVISNGEEEAGSSDGGKDQPDDDPIRSTSSILMFNIGSTSNNIDSSAVARPGSEGRGLSFQQGEPDEGTSKKNTESKRCSEIGNQDLQQTNIPAGGILLARKAARASSGSSSMAESGSLLVQPTSLTSIYHQGPELMIPPPRVPQEAAPILRSPRSLLDSVSGTSGTMPGTALPFTPGPATRPPTLLIAAGLHSRAPAGSLFKTFAFVGTTTTPSTEVGDGGRSSLNGSSSALLAEADTTSDRSTFSNGRLSGKDQSSHEGCNNNKVLRTLDGGGTSSIVFRTLVDGGGGTSSIVVCSSDGKSADKMRGSLINKERTSDGGTSGLFSSNNKSRNSEGGGTSVVVPRGSALNIQLPSTTLNNNNVITTNAPHLMAQTLSAGGGLGLLKVPNPPYLHTSNTSPQQRQLHQLATNHMASSNPQEMIENTHQQVVSRMQGGGSLLAGSPGLQPIPPSTGRPRTSTVIPGVDTTAGRSPAIQLSSERQGSPQRQFTSSSGLKGLDEQDSPKTPGSGGIPYVSRARMKLLESVKVGQSIAAALGHRKEDPGSSGARRGISGDIDPSNPRSSDPDLMLGRPASRPSPFARRSRSFSDINQLINTSAITASAATPTTILELDTDDIKQPPQARTSSLMQQPPVGGMAHSSNLSPKKTFGNKKPSVTGPTTLNPSSGQDSSFSKHNGSAANQNAINAIKRRHPGKGTSVTKGDKASQAVSSSLNKRAGTAYNEGVQKKIEALETSPLGGGWKGFNPKQGTVTAQHGRLISKRDSSSGAEMTATSGQDKKWKTVQADSEEAMVPDGTDGTSRGPAARTRWQQKGLVAPIPGGSSTSASPFLRRSRSLSDVTSNMEYGRLTAEDAFLTGKDLEDEEEEEEKAEDGVIMLHGSSPTSHHITATLASSLSGAPSYDSSTSRLSKEVDDSTTSGTFQKLSKIGQEAGIQLLPPAAGGTTGGVVPRDAASMLAMYCNRVNTSWVEPRARHWTRPAVVPPVQVKGIHGDEHRRSVADNLRRGGIAFWYLAGEDYVSAVTPPTASAAMSATLLSSTVGAATGSLTPSGYQESESQIDIWTSDPYALVGKIRPGLLHGHHGAQAQRHAHSCQSRVLGQLSLAVRDLAGTEALAKTHVVLSVNDEQQEEVMKQLWEFKFYGFRRENVIIITQPRHGGYLYDDEEQRFISPEGEDEDNRLEPTGTGIAAMQLNWHPDAFVMSPEGLMDVLEGSVAELLNHRGVKWMTCYRARDMSLLRGDGILDIGFLSQAFFHRSTAHKSSVVTQVHLSEKLAYARKFGSVVLCHHAGPNTSYNAEVTMQELSCISMIEAVLRAMRENRGLIAVGLQRYAFHVPSLKHLLSSQQNFTPRLKIQNNLLYVRMELADVTRTYYANTIAVQASEHHPQVLTGFDDAELLLQLTQQQNQDPRLMGLLYTSDEHFKKLTSSMIVNEDPTAISAAVFISSTSHSLLAIRMALALTRTDRDSLCLVMVVEEESQVEAGRSLLSGLLSRLPVPRPCGPAEVELCVLVRSVHSTLQVMEGFVLEHSINLVVIPSTGLMKKPEAKLGSVAIAILKRLKVPILILTPRALRSVDMLYGMTGQLRMMLMVEGWSHSLLDYACNRLLLARRGDKLTLAQVYSSKSATKRHRSNMQHIMDTFHIEAVTKLSGGNVSDMLLDGPVHHEEVIRAVEDYGFNLLAMQLPLGTKTISKGLVDLLGRSRAGVLIFQA